MMNCPRRLLSRNSRAVPALSLATGERGCPSDRHSIHVAVQHHGRGDRGVDAVHRGCWSAARTAGYSPVVPAGPTRRSPDGPVRPRSSPLRGHGAGWNICSNCASIRYHCDDARLPPRRPLRAHRRPAAGDRSPRRRARPGASSTRPCSARPAPARRSRSPGRSRPTSKPTLVLAHNKTLAAQLYAEFREFFPDNAVEYFVSYFDYYQPEAYLPRSDTYIEKDSQPERRDRPAPPRRDPRPLRAPRRDHRRLGLLHLRPRRAGRLRRDRRSASARAARTAATPSSASSSTSSTSATTRP